MGFHQLVMVQILEYLSNTNKISSLKNKQNEWIQSKFGLTPIISVLQDKTKTNGHFVVFYQLDQKLVWINQSFLLFKVNKTNGCLDGFIDRFKS